MQELSVLACAREPPRDRGLTGAEDPRGREIGSSPSASAESTMATCCEGVFRRYNGVSRRALNVVRHSWQRNVWIGSVRPCLPSPTSAWKEASVLPK